MKTTQEHTPSVGAALLFILAVLAVGTQSYAFETEHVVLVVIDGLRYSEGLGDPGHTYVPEMYALSQEGTIIEPFTNDGVTKTWRAIPAIWCGAWTEVYTFSDPDCGGSENNYSELPTVFEYYRKQLLKPEEDCIYVLKDVGCVWKGSFDTDYGPDYWPLYHVVGSTDLDVWHEAESLLSTYTPSLMLLYFAQVDQAGHSGDWDYYTSTIAVADSIVGMLWDFLESHPTYSGKTTMLVTNDHGRHDYNFSGHGDDCPGCRTIQLLAVGPDIKEGFVSTIPRTIPDITPTLGALLGFVADDATGAVMTEIFNSADIVDHPACDPLQMRIVPTPFRSETRITFTTIRRGPARISVYDVLGREVARPFDGSLPAGEHSIDWAAVGPEGHALNSGIYFIRIQNGAGSVTRSTVLAR